MSDWETLNCEFHPERIALERCEVCGKALCAYCLYYTEDGQRLCAEHAESARAMGVQVDEPRSDDAPCGVDHLLAYEQGRNAAGGIRCRLVVVNTRIERRRCYTQIRRAPCRERE